MLSTSQDTAAMDGHTPGPPPTTPVAPHSPKLDRGMAQSGHLLKQLSAVAGEGASIRHRWVLILYLIFQT